MWGTILCVMLYKCMCIVHWCQCSARSHPLRVYGGEDATQEAYPYVVRLEIRHIIKLTNVSMIYRESHLCTASALSPTWAITAAHCLVDLGDYHGGDQYVRLVVRYGSVHGLPSDKNTFSLVVLVIPHPMYMSRETEISNVIKNDIGLIKTKPMSLKRFIKLSPVDFRTLYGHEAVFAGFGTTTKKNSDNNITIDDTLELKMSLQIFKVVITKCMTAQESRSLLCLGHQCGRVATVCSGDSGGPVIHASGIVGVLSTGHNLIYCGDPTAATSIDFAGYTCPVSLYVEWIASHVRN